MLSRLVARPLVSAFLRPLSSVPHSTHFFHVSFQSDSRSQCESRDALTVVRTEGSHPQIMDHCIDILQHLKVPFDVEVFNFSYKNPENNDDPELIRQSLKRNRIGLMGHISPSKTTFQGDFLNVIDHFDLFANVTYVKSFPTFPCRHDNVDFVIIREQSEGEYKKIEHEVETKNFGLVVQSLKIITRKNSERIAKFAFDFATKWGRSKVTAVHKANIMKKGDGMFLNCCREVSELYPHIEFEDIIIDNASMQMVSRPEQFDIIVTTNLYGNILENIGAGLVGGPGVVPGEDWSHEQIVYGMGARHSYAKATGMDIANPTMMLLSVANLLNKYYLYDHSVALKNAIYELYDEKCTLTRDFGGNATGSEFVCAIKEKLN